MKVLSHKQIAVSTEKYKKWWFHENFSIFVYVFKNWIFGSAERLRARARARPTRSAQLQNWNSVNSADKLKNKFAQKNRKEKSIDKERVQGKRVSSFLSIWNWDKKNPQILTFLPSLNLTGPSIMGIRSPILSTKLQGLVLHAPPESKQSWAPRLSCRRRGRVPAERQFAQWWWGHQLKREREGGWKEAIDIMYRAGFVCSVPS